MSQPAPPSELPDEPERLRLLQSTGLLEGGIDPEFDDLAQLAARLCDTPMALLSLVDAEHIRFKGSVGVAGDSLPRSQSFCATTVMVEHVLEVEDARADERFAQLPVVRSAPGVRLYVGLPLRVEGHVLGTLCVLDRQPRRLTREQSEALAVLARVATRLLDGRLQSARSQQLQQRLRQVQDARGLGRWEVDLASGDVHLDARMMELLGVSRMGFAGGFSQFLGHVRARDHEALRHACDIVRIGGDATEVEFEVILPGGGMRWVNARIYADRDHRGMARALVGVCADGTARRQRAKEIEIYQRQLNELGSRLEEQSSNDALTGLRNRRYLREALAIAQSRAHRQGAALALATITVDGFAAYNASHGHAHGDAALRAIAGVLARSVRDTDVAARYAGEEFVLLMPDTDLAGGWLLGERIRQRVAELDWQGRPATVSIGVAAASGRDVDYDLLFDEAHRQRSQAQDAGGDRVCAELD
jgi:diguanylate cyclase (GGDEF)-like protein